MFDLIIFDCDGVLIDSEWLAIQIEVEELHKVGFSIPLETFIDLALGRRNEEVEERLWTQFGIRLPSDYWKNVEQRQEREFREKLMPISGIEKVLQSLSIPYCVASSSNFPRLKHSLGVTGLYPYFENHIFGSECVKKGKPEPDIFLYAASQMGVEPKKCLVIEDSLLGIKAGKAAGMEVWAFCGGRHFNLERKKQLSHYEVSHIFDKMEVLGSQVVKNLN